MAEIGEPEKRILVVPNESPQEMPRTTPAPAQPTKVPEREPA